MSPTIADLMEHARQQSRIESCDYFDRRYPRPEEVRAWRRDCAKRSRAKATVLKRWAARIFQYHAGVRQFSPAPLVPGSYYGTRLVISPESIDYIVGQYAPLEIWEAVNDYFTRTN